MSKNIDLKSVNFLSPIKKFYSKYSRHAAFGAMILVLLIYVMVVLKINNLANAEPSSDQETAIAGSIPKIDDKAIQQIQALEASNTQVHSLFEQARNNPFQE